MSQAGSPPEDDDRFVDAGVDPEEHPAENADRIIATMRDSVVKDAFEFTERDEYERALYAFAVAEEMDGRTTTPDIGFLADPGEVLPEGARDPAEVVDEWLEEIRRDLLAQVESIHDEDDRELTLSIAKELDARTTEGCDDE